MSDDCAWKWFVGILQGWGDCIFQASPDIAARCEYVTLRHVVRIVTGPRGEGLVKVPFGCDKHADVVMRLDKIIAHAPADQSAIDNAMNAYGLKTIIAAGAADLDKAPKLRIV